MSEQRLKIILATKGFLVCLVLLFFGTGTVVHAEDRISSAQIASSPIILISQTDVKPLYTRPSQELDDLDRLRLLRKNNQLVPRKVDREKDPTRDYIIRLSQHIRSFWSLSEQHSWDNNNMAIVVITIGREGGISGFDFEKRPENVQFSHLVLEAVLNALPLPSFSDDMLQSELKIGLRFRPGEVF